MKICTPIQLSEQKKVIEQMSILAKKVDVAELWLDHIKDLDLSTLLKNKPLPVLCVCKKIIDKGKFKGTYAKEAEILIKAIKYGADYIDIPLKMNKKLSEKIILEAKNGKREVGSKIIFSYHNFKKTPSVSELRKKVDEMLKRGADILKLAVMGKKLKDAFNLIFLAQELEQKKIPHILITMGKKGVITRVLTPKLGGAMMFAPLKKSSSTAEGQLTVNELKKWWKVFE